MIGRIFVRFSPAPLGGRSQGYTPGLAQMPFTTEQAKRKGYINVLAGGWIGKIDWHPESKSVPIKKICISPPGGVPYISYEEKNKEIYVPVYEEISISKLNCVDTDVRYPIPFQKNG